VQCGRKHGPARLQLLLKINLATVYPFFNPIAPRHTHLPGAPKPTHICGGEAMAARQDPVMGVPVDVEEGKPVAALGVQSAPPAHPGPAAHQAPAQQQGGVSSLACMSWVFFGLGFVFPVLWVGPPAERGAHSSTAHGVEPSCALRMQRAGTRATRLAPAAPRTAAQ
jgi:hypothetical protein